LRLVTTHELGRGAYTHLDGERLEAHQAKILYQLADCRVQRGVAWGGGQDSVSEGERLAGVGDVTEIAVLREQIDFGWAWQL